MEKVCPWCGQPSDRGRLKNRTDAGWQLLKWRAPENNLTLSPCSTLRDRLLFYADYVNIIEGSRSFFATNSKSYNTLVITGQDLRIQNPEGYSEPSKQLSLTPTVSTKRPKHLRLSVCSVTSHFPQYLRARVHYPCSQAVFTGVQNGTRALSTQPTGREHGECVWYGSLFEPSFDNLRVLRGWENDREFIDSGGLSRRTHIIPMSTQNAFRPLQIIDLDRFHRGFRVDICWQYVAVEILILSLD